MKPYYEDGSVTIYHGDALDVLAEVELSIDSVVTDPPYASGTRMEAAKSMAPNVEVQDMEERLEACRTFEERYDAEKWAAAWNNGEVAEGWALVPLDPAEVGVSPEEEWVPDPNVRYTGRITDGSKPPADGLSREEIEALLELTQSEKRALWWSIDNTIADEKREAKSYPEPSTGNVEVLESLRAKLRAYLGQQNDV